MNTDAVFVQIADDNGASEVKMARIPRIGETISYRQDDGGTSNPRKVVAVDYVLDQGAVDRPRTLDMITIKVE